MRLRHRHEDDVTTDERVAAEQRAVTEGRSRGRFAARDRDVGDERATRARDLPDDRLAPPARGRHETETTVETVKQRWDVGSLLAVASGVALIVIGAVALVRTGVDTSWYDPVVRVAGIDHTALLGAVEVGVGALLVLAGLAGARTFAALVALVAGVGAALVAIEPDLVDRELALERGWATALAVAGILLALVLVMARGRNVERRIEHHRPMTA
jgi:lysylphosphatidylglycerol synthetase-like protein (DUF2156 family)